MTKSPLGYGTRVAVSARENPFQNPGSIRAACRCQRLRNLDSNLRRSGSVAQVLGFGMFGVFGVFGVLARGVLGVR